MPVLNHYTHTVGQLFVLLFIAALACPGCSRENSETRAISSNSAKPIIVGWQTAWAPAGQIAQALIHTNIAKQCDVNLNCKGFLFGTEMNEAALNHDLDCENTGSIPAISLLARSKDWTIVGRLIFQPLAVVAGTNSHVEKIVDLRGKSVGVPFGSGPHPYLLHLLKKNNMDIGDSRNQVRLINISPSEQVIALKQGTVDAIATWEPQTAIALGKNFGVLIDEKRHLGVIMVSNKLLKERSDSVVKLLRAYIEANYFVAKHRSQSDAWFAKASGFDQKLISQIRIVEPNLSAKELTDVSLSISTKISQIRKSSPT